MDKIISKDDVNLIGEKDILDDFDDYFADGPMSIVSPQIMNATDCGWPGEDPERFLVIVRRVEAVNKTKAMYLLRKMGYSLLDSKNLIYNCPFHFYDSSGVYLLYYNPEESVKRNGVEYYGEHFKYGKALGFKMLVISTKERDIEKWIERLSEEEREDVVFSLDFYIKLFSDFINNE
jgi:hypothetical protein